MKAFLIMFAILIGKSCAAQLSTSSDTLCLPATVVEKLVIAAQQKNALQEEIAVLNERITAKEKIITSMGKLDSLSKLTVASYEKEISIMKDQRGIYEAELKVVKKQLKVQRRKVFWTGVIGMGTTAAAILFFK